MFAPPPPPDTRHLRKFGLTMAVALGVLGALLLWRRGMIVGTQVTLVASGAFLALALVLPRLLAPLEWAWMKLAAGLSYVMTRVILTLTFYLAITPVGWLVRLSGRSNLRLRPDPSATTYWTQVDREHGPGTRHRAPF